MSSNKRSSICEKHRPRKQALSERSHERNFSFEKKFSRKVLILTWQDWKHKELSWQREQRQQQTRLFHKRKLFTSVCYYWTSYPLIIYPVHVDFLSNESGREKLPRHMTFQEDVRQWTFLLLQPYSKPQVAWCSGYHVCFTRRRSPVRTWLRSCFCSSFLPDSQTRHNHDQFKQLMFIQTIDFISTPLLIKQMCNECQIHEMTVSEANTI